MKGLPDFIEIYICQDKEVLSPTQQLTFLTQRYFLSWANLPFGDSVVDPSGTGTPLRMPAGVVTSKSSSVSVPLVVRKGISVPRMAGLIPACPAGRILFWTSGLGWLLGRMAPGSTGWKMRPVRMCGATGWSEEGNRKQS